MGRVVDFRNGRDGDSEAQRQIRLSLRGRASDPQETLEYIRNANHDELHHTAEILGSFIRGIDRRSSQYPILTDEEIMRLRAERTLCTVHMRQYELAVEERSSPSQETHLKNAQTLARKRDEGGRKNILLLIEREAKLIACSFFLRTKEALERNDTTAAGHHISSLFIVAEQCNLGDQLKNAFVDAIFNFGVGRMSELTIDQDTIGAREIFKVLSRIINAEKQQNLGHISLSERKDGKE